MSFPELKAAIGEIGESFATFRKSQEERFGELRERLEVLEAARMSPGSSTKKAAAPALCFKSADGREFPVLNCGDRWTERDGAKADEFSLAEFVSAAIKGSTSTKAVSSGPALVDTVLSREIIDAVRARTTVVAAGARTVMVADGGTVMGRITGDPTVHQHTEGANDITVSDMTMDAVTLTPKALVARVPITAEAMADSPNLDNALRTSLAAAFAVKLDALALAKILADTNVPKSSAGQDPALWAKCLEAVGAALAANQPVPASMITNTADFIARAAQLASTAGSWLGKPPALAGMTELPTTGIAAGTALYGGFDAAVIIAMRQELRLEVVRFADAGRYQHELIAHMRVDGYVAQPARLFKQLKTVV